MLLIEQAMISSLSLCKIWSARQAAGTYENIIVCLCFQLSSSMAPFITFFITRHPVLKDFCLLNQLYVLVIIYFLFLIWQIHHRVCTQTENSNNPISIGLLEILRIAVDLVTTCEFLGVYVLCAGYHYSYAYMTSVSMPI